MAQFRHPTHSNRMRNVGQKKKTKQKRHVTQLCLRYQETRIGTQTPPNDAGTSNIFISIYQSRGEQVTGSTWRLARHRRRPLRLRYLATGEEFHSFFVCFFIPFKQSTTRGATIHRLINGNRLRCRPVSNDSVNRRSRLAGGPRRLRVPIHWPTFFQPRRQQCGGSNFH